MHAFLFAAKSTVFDHRRHQALEVITHLPRK